MCNFFSGIITREGVVYHNAAESDSHEDIISKFGLKDTDNDTAQMDWARFEITPPNNDVFKPFSQWSFRIDQRITPDWLNDGYKVFCFDALFEFSKEHFITDAVEEIFSGRYWMSDTARVGTMSGTARVVTMSGTARVDWMSDTARVGTMRDTARVDWMRDTARVVTMRDTASVGTMSGTARVEISDDCDACVQEIEDRAIVVKGNKIVVALGSKFKISRSGKVGKHAAN